MSQEQTTELVVFQDGLGKAGMDLHGEIWNALDGFDVSRIGYDIDPARRAAAEESGKLAVIHSLDELPNALQDRTLHVVDNTTASGKHAESTNATLAALMRADITPAAWLLEKPVVSGNDERIAMLDALEQIGDERVFVNENYLASEAVVRGRAIIAEQAASGNPMTGIAVHFVKDRVPNVVLDNRFTDQKGLAVFGIEMPHQLAIASSLLDQELNTARVQDGGSVIENRYLHDIDGIEQSEGNLTIFEQDGVRVTLRQGLGPFDFRDDGSLVRREYDWKTNQAERYARVSFANGNELMLLFDPVPGAPRYHSNVSFSGETGVTLGTVEDNTLHNLISAVAVFAATGGQSRPALLNQLSPHDAMRYAEQLSELRADAGDSTQIPLGGPDSNFAQRYLQILAAEKAARQQ